MRQGKGPRGKRRSRTRKQFRAGKAWTHAMQTQLVRKGAASAHEAVAYADHAAHKALKPSVFKDPA